MRAVGIDVRENFLETPVYRAHMLTGEFDLILDCPSKQPSPSKPWSRFEWVMSSKNWRPIGEKMTENIGRFNNPNDKKTYIAAVDSLLRLIPTLSDNARKKTAYRELNRIFMLEQPTIPLTYRPEQFYAFSTRHWTNFPTEKNPYCPPQVPGVLYGSGINLLWEITPVSAK
jgi:peptide/nickel transport system substrate-binding protein